MKKSKIKFFMTTIIALTVLVIFPAFSLAQTFPTSGSQIPGGNAVADYGEGSYTLLETLPTGVGEPTTSPTFSGYLSWLFRFALAAAAFLAVLYIVLGGMAIMLEGGSFAAQTKGRDMISNAIWGLILALMSWLILYTINPSFTTMELIIPPVTLEKAIQPALKEGWKSDASDTLYATLEECEAVNPEEGCGWYSGPSAPSNKIGWKSTATDGSNEIFEDLDECEVISPNNDCEWYSGPPSSSQEPQTNDETATEDESATTPLAPEQSPAEKQKALRLSMCRNGYSEESDCFSDPSCQWTPDYGCIGGDTTIEDLQKSNP
jgi:hypothetical protein